MTDPVEIKNLLKAEALRLGFVLAGVTLPQRPPHFQAYETWLASGFQAGMAYLAGELALAGRRDPAALLPGCRSILVLAFPYAPPSPALPPPGCAQIAAYAAGDDYHHTLPPRINHLAHFLQSLTDQPFSWKAFTDSAPLLERDLAVQAGLGWIGRNTCLIHPRLGSWFFLAELLLTLALPPDAPFSADHCGHCQRCVEACPTGSLNANRQLDARRCLSYLTIENKDAIPPEWRPALHHHVFGCDICQSVCPWNSHIPAPHSDAQVIDLLDVISLTPAEFKDLYASTPVQRARHRGLLRNACAVLGHAGTATHLPALQALLHRETDPVLLEAATWAVEQIQRRLNP